MSKARYDDNQFYEAEHGPILDWKLGKKREWWEAVEPPSATRAEVKAYSYQQYQHHYQLAEQERILLTQQAQLSEQEFLRLKKSLLDVLNVRDQTDRTARRIADLMDRLSLNPYQRYRYEDYVSRYRVAQGRKLITPNESPLSGAEFLEMKRELLNVSTTLRKRVAPHTQNTTRELQGRETTLRSKLFPPVPLYPV